MSRRFRHLIFIPVSFLLLLAACTTVRLDPIVAKGELEALRPSEYPPFTAIGSIVAKGVNNGGKATILLAGSGDKFRLQIIDPTGRMVLAAAGAPRFLVTMDPATGKRDVIRGDEADFIHHGSMAIPLRVISSLVTGAPPLFESVVSSAVRRGKKVVKTKNPELELVYSSRLESIKLLAGLKKATVIFGPNQKDTAIPYVTGASIDFGVASATAEIKWKSVTHRQSMPEGFFTYSEPGVD